MSNQEHDDLYSDEGAQRVDTPPEIPKGQPGKLENIMALGKNPASKRGLMLTIGGVAFAVVAIAIAVNRMANPPQPQLPPEIQGVNVGGAPGSFRDNSVADVGKTEQFETMVQGVEQQRQLEAQQQQASVQPLAIGVERALKPVPVAEQMPAQAPYAPPVYQTTQAPVQQDPAYTAMLQNARSAIDSLAQERKLGTDVFDAPIRQAQAGGNGAGSASGQGAQNGSPQQSPGAPAAVTMIAAGKVESVRIDTAVNSDLGGEFVATLLTGPYAGARLIGTAERAGTMVKPKFTVLSLPSTGVSVPIQALGLDAQTLESGTATDVDRKLFIKYGVQPLAAALSALGQAVAQSGSTTVINGDTTITTNPELDPRRINGIAIGAAAQALSKDANALDTTPTVRVAPGTIIGVVFTRDVVYNARS